MPDAAPTAAATQRARRRARATAIVTSFLLVATAAAVPAQADDAAPHRATIHDFAPRDGRASSTVPLEQPEVTAADGLMPLEATPTTREGSDPARTPQILKRAVSLWMSRSFDITDWPEPEHKVGTIDVVQDLRAKTLTATIPFDATPTAELNSISWIYVGTWKNANKQTCEGKIWLAVLGNGTSTDGAFLKTGGSAGTATRSISGSTVTVTGTGPDAANPGYDCAYAYVDKITGPDTSEELWSGGADEFEAEVEKAPVFDFFSYGDLNAAYPGKWTKIRINVENDGDLAAKGVKIKLSGKNLTFKKKTLKVGKLGVGKDKTVTARVKLKGKKTRKLNIAVTANGGWKAKTSTKVGYRPHPKKVKNLVGKRYWATFTGEPSERIYQFRGLTFVNKKWVYLGVPKNGGIPKCSSKVKECKKYSYNAKKGTLKVGKLRAKVDSEGIRTTKGAPKGEPKLMYYPLKNIKKGAKLELDSTFLDGQGRCGITYSCHSWWYSLKLNKNGTFTSGYSWMHTFGYIPNQIMSAGSDPDITGTYKVLSKSRIQLSYTDPETGKKKKDTYIIGIDPDVLGKYSFAKNDILIGQRVY